MDTLHRNTSIQEYQGFGRSLVVCTTLKPWTTESAVTHYLPCRLALRQPLQENAFSRASSPDGEESEMPSHQFTLPKDDYGKMMFERRLAPEGSSSPPASTRPPSAGSTSMVATGRASTIEDTEGIRTRATLKVAY